MVIDPELDKEKPVPTNTATKNRKLLASKFCCLKKPEASGQIKISCNMQKKTKVSFYLYSSQFLGNCWSKT